MGGSSRSRKGRHGMKPGFDAHIKALWNEMARRHQRDPDNRAASRFQVFNRTADDLARLLTHVDSSSSGSSRLWPLEGPPIASSPIRPATCADCGDRELEHFYTSKCGGDVLCSGCFQRRNPQEAVSSPSSNRPRPPCGKTRP